MTATPESSRPEEPTQGQDRPAQDAAPDAATDPETSASTDDPSAEPASPADPAAPTDDPSAEDVDDLEGIDDATTLYVRRSRTPALGFWVLLAIVVGAIVGLIVAFFSGAADLGGIALFVAYGAMFVGIPLAAVAALVDAIRNRRR